jgi:hypothetical protein
LNERDHATIANPERSGKRGNAMRQKWRQRALVPRKQGNSMSRREGGKQAGSKKREKERRGRDSRKASRRAQRGSEPLRLGDSERRQKLKQLATTDEKRTIQFKISIWQ